MAEDFEASAEMSEQIHPLMQNPHHPNLRAPDAKNDPVARCADAFDNPRYGSQMKQAYVLLKPIITPDAPAIGIVPQIQKCNEQKGLISIGPDITKPATAECKQAVDVASRGIGDGE